LPLHGDDRVLGSVPSSLLRGWRLSLQRLRSEDGQALIELALVIPILLLVLLAIVDFGKAINYWNDENHLANLGARYGAVGALPTFGPCISGTPTLASYLTCEAGIDSPELQNGNGSTTQPGVKSPGVSVCVNVPNNSQGQPVQVKVSASYNWLPLPNALGVHVSQVTSSTLSGTATMMLEAPMPSGWITSTLATGCT
jgi:hypothetical protein